MPNLAAVPVMIVCDKINKKLLATVLILCSIIAGFLDLQKSSKAAFAGRPWPRGPF